MTTLHDRTAAPAAIDGPVPGRRLRLPKGLGALPISAWLLLFFVLPFGLVVWYSFGYKPGLYGTHANDVLSLDRYGQAASPAFLAIFVRTLKIAVTGTVLCLVIAFPMAYWMAVKLSSTWRGVLLALVLIPYWTNFLVRTIGWQISLSPEGFVSKTLQWVHLTDGPLRVLYTSAAVQLGVVYNYLPLMILPLYVALERLDPRLLEASRDLGGTAWSTLCHVTIPLARPGITAGMMLVFVPLMGDYITPTVLGGASGSMVGQMVAAQFQSAQNWALGSAMAVLLMLAIFGTTAVVGAALKVVGLVTAAATSLVLPSRETT
ncbi:ABC transporter permease [Mycolicibacterium madagascariense]|uniref:ABC transporter permease n=1 Tax=Mycolicibacterium madagascariense TaxID=212765 RepID=A0A7I7XJB0_9MYCO|nr:ABC transporter permease [Mycolicibacterium madagascariense]MCV7015116.1 ABC transporter permease [Mycolicibacterium madagascariense]BBZ29297.1 ABC transporter permease [Mycolicibacterium madagascariense]